MSTDAEIAQAAAASAASSAAAAASSVVLASQQFSRVAASDMATVDADPTSTFRVQQDARLSASYAGRVEAASYTYNADGTVATETVGGFTTTYAYNADGTVHTVTRNGVTLTYSYDSSGNVTAVA